ncbi:MAG: tetratricopeptide repeat protein [Prevotella sp.]
MKKGTKAIFVVLLLYAAFSVLSSCSTQKNTASSRWWHSFNARYNTYFNGSQAFIEGSKEKEDGHSDNFTEQLPLYPASSKKSKDIGKQNFERAVTKSEKAIKRHSIKRRPVWDKKRRKTERDIEWLNRREYNPFIWKAWLLLGKSQFQMGEFEEAAATFSYMSRLYNTQPAIKGIARAWLAKSYTELDWLYDAEDVIVKMRRDSMDYRAVKDWDYTYCDFYLHNGNRKEAINYLQRVIRHERRRKQRAREWFLMGQLQAAEGNQQAAYKAFRKVVRMSPPYELSFNARIAMTEVMAAGHSKKMVNRLKRMAASDNNKDYLEQVYYAIGNIHLMNGDTLRAISAYEEGNRKATRSGIEKGVLLLTLGNIYWQRQQYADARRCYGEAIGLLDKDRPDYGELSERSVVLDELVPHLETIHLQDSLQYLATTSEEERNAAIDRQIEMVKKREKEERDRELDAEAEKIQQEQQAMGNTTGQQQTKQPASPTLSTKQGQGLWYFYNPSAVSQGKAAFERLWGKRANVDNWQRANKTVLEREETGDEGCTLAADAASTGAEGGSGQGAEGGSGQGAEGGSGRDAEDGSGRDAEGGSGREKDGGKQEADNKTREYYLAQIPFSEEQKAASDALLTEGLLSAGIIMKDKMEDLALSRRQLERLVADYPDYERNDETLYHLFLLYSRLGLDSKAQWTVEQLKERWAESEYTRLLTNPYYLDDARWGEHIEDSIYAATYEAFKANRFDVVKANVKISDERFSQGYNRARFIFIDALSMLNEGLTDECITRMTEVVENHPTSEVAEMAGMIVKGVRQGRRLQGGGFGFGDVWSRRSAAMNTDSASVDTLSKELDAPHVVILAFRTDSVDTNQMLFELAKYNFTNFLVRNFEIEVEGDEGISRLTVSGFLSYDEATQYRRQLTTSFSPLKELGQQLRLYVVSEANRRLLGTTFSYADYEQFFDSELAPVKTSEDTLLDEPTEIVDGEEMSEEGDLPENEDESDDEEEEEMFDFEEDFYR